MINIPNKNKHRYYDALEAAQTDGDLRPFTEFMIVLLQESDIWF